VSSTSNPSGTYTNPDGTITLLWTITGDEITFDLIGQTPGWVAIGIANDGGMPYSDIALGWVDDSNNSHFFACNVGSSRDRPTYDLQQNLNLISFSRTSTTTNFKWSRKLVITDPGYISITNKQFYLIWAYNNNGGTSNNDYSQHLPNTRGVAIVNFFTGMASNNDTTKSKIHGLLMLVSWGVLAIIAIFVARFGKQSFGTKWFPLHWGLLSMAILLTIVAFCLIVAQRQQENLAHFNDTHEEFGLLTVVLCLVQTFFGYLADQLFDTQRKSAPLFPDKVHWWLGRLTGSAALISIVLGLLKNGANLWGAILFSSFIFVAIILFIIQQYTTGAVSHTYTTDRKPGDRNICYILTILCLLVYIPVAVSIFIY